jgi:hypothetical protein
MPRPHAEYDDDRPSPKSSNTVLWVILGVGGGILLLVVLVCGGIMYVGYSGFQKVKAVVEDVQAAQGSAEAFLTFLQGENVDKAYDVTGSGFKARQTKAQFERFVSDHPGLSPHDKRSSNSFQMNTNNGVTNYTARFSLTGPNGNMTCTLILVVENGQWVVDSITVP